MKLSQISVISKIISPLLEQSIFLQAPEFRSREQFERFHIVHLIVNYEFLHQSLPFQKVAVAHSVLLSLPLKLEVLDRFFGNLVKIDFDGGVVNLDGFREVQDDIALGGPHLVLNDIGW